MTLVMVPVAGYALQIIFPTDETYLYKSGHLIVKGGETPELEGITIDINGVASDVIDISSPAYRKAFRDFLILEVELDPGENRIKAEGFARGKRVSEARATVFLADERGALPPKRFKAGDFHDPQREVLCQGCHNMNPSPRELADPNQRKNPCGSCHGKMINRKHVHGPAGVFDCSACHQLESRPLRYAVAGADGQICLECHDDKVKEFRAAKFVHGPVEANLCVVCHDPHASDFSAQLRDEVNRLCSECHAPVQVGMHVLRGVDGSGHPLTRPRDPANHNKPFNCVSCHDPHKGNSESLFAYGFNNRFALCQKCHQK